MITAAMVATSVAISGGTGYVVQVNGEWRTDSAGGSVNLQVTVPFGTSRNKRDELVRESAASAILASSGIAIDPDDIYVPFAAK